MIGLLNYDNPMIRSPSDAATGPRRRRLSPGAWFLACVLLVALTWTPVLVNHLRNMRIADNAAGMFLVVFPLTASTRDVFRSIEAARGAPLKPVSWMPRAWIVQSSDFGFAGRLRERGAWGVYSPNVLSMRQVLSCTGMVSPPSANPADPGPLL
jgi:hypothetical protein